MNLPTLLIGLGVAALIAAIVAREVVNRRKGKSGCSCGGDCSSCKGCH